VQWAAAIAAYALHEGVLATAAFVVGACPAAGRLRHAPSRMRISSLASVWIAAGLKTSESLHVHADGKHAHADVKIFARRLHLISSCEAYLRASIARLQHEDVRQETLPVIYYYKIVVLNISLPPTFYCASNPPPPPRRLLLPSSPAQTNFQLETARQTLILHPAAHVPARPSPRVR
jgi:hypothetical protein